MTIGSNCHIIDTDGNMQVLSSGEPDKCGLPENTRNLLEHAQWVSTYTCVPIDMMYIYCTCAGQEVMP